MATNPRVNLVGGNWTRVKVIHVSDPETETVTTHLPCEIKPRRFRFDLGEMPHGRREQEEYGRSLKHELW